MDRWEGGVYEIKDSSLRELCIPEAVVSMMYNGRRRVGAQAWVCVQFWVGILQ